MNFQNTALLVALAAIGIPIALHLIARKEPKQVVFPSVRLLTQRFETNRSKVRIRRWWLLALRIAAVAVVALALARPVVAGSLSIVWSTIGILSVVGVGLLAMASVAASKPGHKSLMWSLMGVAIAVLLGAIGWGGWTLAQGTKPDLDNAAPVALAIVIDNAPLAGWRTNDDAQLSRLQSAAKELMLSASPNSRIALIDRSSTPAAFSLDLSSALARVDALESLEVVRPIESRIEAAARLLQTSEISSRQLVILSGLAESSFSSDASGGVLAKLVNETGIRVTLWDVGGFDGMNRQVSIPTLSDGAPAPETTITVAAVVSMEQSTAIERKPSPSVRVTAECLLYPNSASLPVVRDGQILRPEPKPVDRVNVELNPGRDVELLMTLPPLPAGIHHGAIRLVGEDALAIDDVGYFTVKVLPPSRLLLVGDQTDELNEIAWAVTASANSESASQYEIEQIAFEDLAASPLTDFDGVIMLDPPENAFNDAEMERYLAIGGSVLAAVGSNLGNERVSIDRWPQFDRRWRVSPPGTFLEISASSHPALFGLSNTPGGVPFQDFRIYQYWQTDPGTRWQTLMRYAGTDHPALLERSFNEADNGPGSDGSARGRVMILTTPIPALVPPSQAWNDLFSADESWPAFALVRDVIRYLAGRSTDSLTVAAGVPVSVPIQEQPVADSQSRRLQWFPAVGSSPIPIDVPQSDAGEGLASKRILVGQPMHAGVHWIRGDALGLGFTVNVPRPILDTTRVDPAELANRFGDDAFRQIDSLDEMEWTASDGSEAVSLWSPIMLLALFVFMLEQVLGNRFYGRSSGAGTGTPKRRAAA